MVAAEPPIVSFGTIQEEKEIFLQDEYTTYLHFFSPYGNRDLHIQIKPAPPPGWEIIVEPPLVNRTHQIGGRIVAFEENLNISTSGPEQAEKVKIRIAPKEVEAGKHLISIDATAYDLSAMGLVGLAQSRRFQWVVNVGPGEKKVVNETISSTVSNLPIEFGIIRPGLTERAKENEGFPMKVKIDELTTTDVSLLLAGSDFFADSRSFGIGNLSYSDSPTGIRTRMDNVYREPPYEWRNLSAGDEKEIYFWITVPTAQPPGTYTTTISVAISPAELVPEAEFAKAEVIGVVPITPTPTPLPSPSPTPSPAVPGFPAVLTFAILAFFLLLKRSRPR